MRRANKGEYRSLLEGSGSIVTGVDDSSVAGTGVGTVIEAGVDLYQKSQSSLVTIPQLLQLAWSR